MFQLTIGRLGGKFSDCREEKKADITQDIFAEHYSVNYSSKVECFHISYLQNKVSERERDRQTDTHTHTQSCVMCMIFKINKNFH